MGTIGSRIRQLRKSHDLTQVALAKAVGIDQSTLSDIEREVGFSADVLFKLSIALGTSAEYIMSGADLQPWPFERALFDRFRALKEKQQGIIEGVLRTEIERAELRPTDDEKRKSSSSPMVITPKVSPRKRQPGK